MGMSPSKDAEKEKLLNPNSTANPTTGGTFFEKPKTSATAAEESNQASTTGYQK